MQKRDDHSSLLIRYAKSMVLDWRDMLPKTRFEISARCELDCPPIQLWARVCAAKRFWRRLPIGCFRQWIKGLSDQGVDSVIVGSTVKFILDKIGFSATAELRIVV